MFRTLVVALCLMIPLPSQANPIQDENRRAGTTAWQLRNRATAGEIEGYASATSVNVGESIRLYVSTDDPALTIEIFRMGWYGGEGARRMSDPVTVPGHRQLTPSPEPVTGLVECSWTDPFLLTVPQDWVSGVFLAKLTGSLSAKQGYIIFIVRDDERVSDFLYQSSATTSQAYNNWGGKSLYPFNSTGLKATNVSFDRPYSQLTGPHEFLYNWEYPMVRFIERDGFDVSYITGIDIHNGGEKLRRHRGLLSVGHDEYWSREMRRNVEKARDETRLHLAFFAANVCYWQMRLENGRSGERNRIMVAYKENALESDPILYDGDPTNDDLATTRWRDVPVNRPEEDLIGVMTSISQVDGDIVIENAGHWVFAGTGLVAGDRLPGLAGYEVDRIFTPVPSNKIRLAHSPVTRADGRSDFADMSIYEARSGAMVFATGTIQWSWGLDEGPSGRRRTNAAAQQITRNVLFAFIRGTPPATRGKRRSSSGGVVDAPAGNPVAQVPPMFQLRPQRPAVAMRMSVQ